MINQKNNDLARTLLSSFFIVSLAIGSLWILRPFLPALIWATTIVVSTWPLLLKAQARLKGKRSLAVVVMMCVMAVVVLLPLIWAFATFISHTDQIVTWARGLGQSQLPPPPQWLIDLPILSDITKEWTKLSQEGAGNISNILQPYLRKAVGWIIDSVGSMSIFLVHLLLTFAISGILYSTGEKVAAGLILFARRLAGDRGETAVVLAGQSIKAVAMGIVITAAVQTVLAGLGVYFANVPYPGVITAIILVCCIAQIGPLLPLVGCISYLYMQDQNTAATLLLVWGIPVGLLDNFLRPVLIHKGADLPLLLILSGVIGGLFAFGVVGLFIGPVILAVTFRLGQAWVEEKTTQDEEKDWPSVQKSYRTDAPDQQTEI